MRQSYPPTRAQAKASGSLYYCTGKPCKHGHVALRLTSNGTCGECHAPRNRVNVRRWQREQAKHDPTGFRERNAKRAVALRAKDPEKARVKDKRNREKADPAVSAARRKAWRIANAERVRAYQLAYDAARKDDSKRQAAKRFSKRRCEAIERAGGGGFTYVDIERLLAEQGGRCIGYGCGLDIRDSYTVEHLLPLSRGGNNDPANIALLCRSCNARKNARTMQEWFVSIGAL